MSFRDVSLGLILAYFDTCLDNRVFLHSIIPSERNKDTKGFRTGNPRSASLEGGLFWAEENQDPVGS